MVRKQYIERRALKNRHFGTTVQIVLNNMFICCFTGLVKTSVNTSFFLKC